MVFKVILGLAVLAVTCPVATSGVRTGECRDQNGPIVLIRLVRGNVPALVKARAEAVAAQILRPAGIHLRWYISDFPPNLRRCASLVVVLEFGGRIPAGSLDVLGFANPYASSGTTIHVLWDRIESECHKELWGPVLGHVFAHEITHVLEGFARHSDEGLMKPHWSEADFYGMLYKPLPSERTTLT
jgi:hypothetical protein